MQPVMELLLAIQLAFLFANILEIFQAGMHDGGQHPAIGLEHRPRLAIVAQLGAGDGRVFEKWPDGMQVRLAETLPVFIVDIRYRGHCGGFRNGGLVTYRASRLEGTAH